MNDIMAAIRAIERRARAVRALRVAAICFYASVVPVLVAFLLERAHIVAVSDSAWHVFAVLPVVILLASFGIARRMPIDTSRVLLRVDISLGSEERLSSFYEMHRHHQTGPYLEMLESRLRAGRLRWSRALPLGRIAQLLPAGLALLAGVLVISSLFPVSHEIPAPAVSEAVATSATRTTSSIGTDGQRGMSEMGSQGSSAVSGTSMGSAQPKHDLQDVLGNLWGNPSAPGVISSDQQGLDQLISQQRQAAERLKELISRIQKRLAEGNGGLTPEERNALSTLARQIGNESLRQALQGLASEKDPKELEKRLQETQRLAESLQKQLGSSPAQAMRNEPSDASRQGAREGLAYTEPMAGKADTNKNRESTGGGAPSASRTTHGAQRDKLQGDDEPFGGEGSANASSPPTSASPQFTRREIVGSIAGSGDFKDFVTKGVPLEQAPSAEGNPPALRVDYDQLRALLSARMLPSGAEDVVRRYFDEISQGGE